VTVLSVSSKLNIKCGRNLYLIISAVNFSTNMLTFVKTSDP